MKFIHTADIHWGMIPDSDKPWGKKREQAIRLTFQGIIEDARDSRADLLLISGDPPPAAGPRLEGSQLSVLYNPRDQSCHHCRKP